MTKMQGELTHMCFDDVPITGDPCPKCQEHAAQQVELALDPPPDYSSFGPTERGLNQAIHTVVGVRAVIVGEMDKRGAINVHVGFEEDAPEGALERVRYAVDQVKPVGVVVEIVVRP